MYFTFLHASNGNEIEYIDVRGIHFTDECGLNSVGGISKFEIKELEGNDGVDCDFAAEIAEVDDFFCHANSVD